MRRRQHQIERRALSFSQQIIREFFIAEKAAFERNQVFLECDFRNWEFYAKISRDDANQSIHHVHAKKDVPQRTVIPLHYQVVDDQDDLTGV